MTGKAWLQALRRDLAPAGLNHIGVTPTKAWDAEARPETRSSVLAPGARSVVVVASAGPAHWQAFVAAARADPQVLLGSAHPLDAFTRRSFEAVDPHQKWFYASNDVTVTLDFRTLAVLAGLGASSRLGLVLDPGWGPWLGLRAAAFVPHELPPTPPAKNLCECCDAPCVSACPGGAFDQGHWSVRRCSAFHQEAPDCDTRCTSREACPVGTEHAYPPLERLYHYNRALGRAALRAELGLPASADPHTGSGPYWGSWR